MLSKKLITSIGELLITASAVLAFPETPRRIDISAKKFSYSPSEITLKKNETVVLVFHSEDGTHGFKLSEMNIKSDEIKQGKDSECLSLRRK